MPESFDLGEAYDSVPEDGGTDAPVDDGREQAVVDEAPVVDTDEPAAVDTRADDERVADDERFAPAWFDEISAALQYSGAPQQQPPQEYYQQPPPGYVDPNQQYYQQPQQQPQRDVRQDIDQLFTDPRAFIANAARAGLEPLQRQYAGQAQAELQRIRHSNATNAMYNVRSALDKNYEDVLNKDNSFKGNEDVRGLVEGTLRNLSMQAANAAYGGNFAPTKVFENPRFYKAILAGARELAGFPSVSSDPAVPRGHAPSRVTPQQDRGKRVKLPPDLEDVARAVGSDAYRAELEKAYAEAEEYNDISWR